MKTVKIIAILLSVLVFCNVLTACAGGNKEQSKQDPVQDEAEQNESTQQPIDDSGQAEREQELRETEKYAYPDHLIGFEEGDDGGQAERERAVREADEQDKEEDRLVPREGDDGGQAEREREAREADERAEQERQRQEEEMRQQEESESQKQEEEMRQQMEQKHQQQTGGYEHHVGDAVFYTEHDLQKYIVPKETNPSHYWLDIEAMLFDVWGTNGVTQVGNGYALSNRSSFNMAVSYFNIDDNTSNKRMVVSSTGGEEQYRSVITSWNTPKPDDSFLVIKGDSRGFGLTPDMAAILLFVLEQTESNPRGNIAGELGLPSNYECTY